MSLLLCIYLINAVDLFNQIGTLLSNSMPVVNYSGHKEEY